MFKQIALLVLCIGTSLQANAPRPLNPQLARALNGALCITAGSYLLTKGVTGVPVSLIAIPATTVALGSYLLISAHPETATALKVQAHSAAVATGTAMKEQLEVLSAHYDTMGNRHQERIKEAVNAVLIEQGSLYPYESMMQ